MIASAPAYKVQSNRASPPPVSSDLLPFCNGDSSAALRVPAPELTLRGGIYDVHADQLLRVHGVAGAALERGLAGALHDGLRAGAGESRSVDAPAAWSGRIWGRTLCAADPGSSRFTCATGECGSGAVECSGGGAAPPTTLAEFTLSGAGGNDFYDVSLVDGSNLPMVVVPQGGAGGASCGATGCLADLNGPCPSDLKVVGPDGAGIACKSACGAYGRPQDCCSGDYATPATCQPSASSQFFKNACPRAYSYAYDDATSTFTCASGTASYLITFCPSISSLKSSVVSSGTNPPSGPGLPLINDTSVSLAGRGDGRSSSSPYAYASSAPSLSAPCPLALAAAAFTWLCAAPRHRLRL